MTRFLIHFLSTTCLIRRFLILILVTFHCPSVSAEDEASGLMEALGGSVRELRNELQALHCELLTLPELPAGSNGGSLGFHGESSDGGEWVTVDLGKNHPIESIVLVPVNIDYARGKNRDYGFPVEFLVEISADIDFAAGRIIADSSVNPLKSPIPAAIFETPGLEGRYVRITATQPWKNPDTGRAIFALGELMVFSHGRNIAPRKKVFASRSLEAAPMWSIENLVDSQSGLGSPVSSHIAPLNGYHSEIETVPDVEKWVQVDLGAVATINEVRIVPARPIDWAESHGFGFPRSFRIETALTPDFDAPRMLLDQTNDSYPNPGDNPIVIPTEALKARYVRFTATRLWERESDFVFALAELQVFRGSENIALGKVVSALDTVDATSWSKDALVDGFDSRHELVDDELTWIRGVVRRQRLSEESVQLEAAMRNANTNFSKRIIGLAGAAGGAVFLLIGFIILRSRALQKRETNRLRERIASDLHDEIGSNLGSIALLSEIGGSQKDLAEINRVARETAASMQDIAWVIRSGHDTLDDLILRIREVAAAMLVKIEYSFDIVPENAPVQKISLNFKRNTLLFVKEALHNIVRHSGASRAQIKIETTQGEFRIDICDNGKGFDPEASESLSGSGLKNFKKRAKSIDGSATIQSSLGDGTTITLQAGFR